MMQGDHNQPLPPELDWDNMKDGIFDKIQSLEKEQAAKRNNPYSGKRIGFLIILLFSLILGLFLISQNIMKTPGSEAGNIAQSPELDKPKGTSNEIEKSTITGQKEFSGESSGRESNLVDRLNTEKDPESIQDPKNSERARTDNDQLATYGKINEIDSPHQPENTDRHQDASGAYNTAQEGLSPLAELGLPDLRSNTPEPQALRPYILNPISLEKRNSPLIDVQQPDHVFPSGIHRRKYSSQFVLEGGLTFWNAGYGNTRPERAQYEITLPSFQLQGHYMKSFSRNYFVMAGLQYQQLESRFQYNQTIEDYQITLEDTIIQVRNNVITGEQNIIRGDVEQSVQAERRVQHFNKFKLFKVSIGLGKTWRIHSFQTDVYLAGALNSLVQNQGRTFFNDSVLDYNGASNSLFQNQLAPEGILGARLHYDLNRNIGFTIGFQAQKSLANWSNQDGIDQYPGSFSLQMGLHYSL